MDTMTPHPSGQGKIVSARAAVSRIRKGSTVATFANLNKLTIQDFAFVRGILSGMEPEAAFKRFYANRYFDADGNVAVHGHTVTARAEELTRRIATTAQKVDDEEIRAAGRRLAAADVDAGVTETVREKAHLAFEDWAAQLPDGMFGENEMADRYQEYLEEQGTPEAVSQSSEYRALFGGRGAGALAFYSHRHDHTHLPDGRVQHADGSVTDHCHPEDGHHHAHDHVHNHVHGPDCGCEHDHARLVRPPAADGAAAGEGASDAR